MSIRPRSIEEMMQTAARLSDHRNPGEDTDEVEQFTMDVNFCWAFQACPYLGIPIAHDFHDGIAEPIPQVLREQFHAGILVPGFTVNYEGKQFVVVCLNDQMLPYLNRELNPEVPLRALTLSPREYFRFDN